MEQKKQAYSGKLTQGTKKRLTRAIDLLVQAVKPVYVDNPITGTTQRHKLSFITLTISQKQNITAKEAYNKAFKHFIQWMRRTMKVNTYVWKVEIQKRGQIHYHITTTSWIHYQSIRDKWNSLQRNAGWLKDYYNQKGHYNPNSTDIHEVRHIKDLSSYLIKEFCKSIQNPLTEGKIWDCSTNLKSHKYFNTFEDWDTHYQIMDAAQKGKCEVIELEHCAVIKLKSMSNTEFMNLEEIQRYDKLLTSIRTIKKDT